MNTSLGGRAIFICNFPPGKTARDAIELMTTFGDINRAQVADEEMVTALLPPHRRRPKMPEALREAAMPTSGAVAIIEFQDPHDAIMAAENIDGALFYGYELVAGLSKRLL